ncbi:glycosyltransferase family 2 protein [Cellulomonas chengniuliangii]|uniref:glycosyltransferase family 2 protein n=1 Tax=Cellulomonas chengniuliangii TaxID=2968084 RepID=UPI001D0E2208|nr:glycosyltransferase family 2 protein [Cellulomonas chengniuliangii]MCC2316934.1 glycosyltransferase family 2 protein [Cellulomonas chengniuliangii]
MTTLPRVTALMLAYGAEPYLHDAVDAVLASAGVDVDLVLVDNGCTTDAVRGLPDDPRITLVTPPQNLGFTGGMNLAARRASGDYLLLVNSDAIVEPDAARELVAALARPGVGVAGGSVRLADQPDLVNSVGNPLHVLGLSWAGGMGDPATDHATRGPVASASGACMALRRSLWESLGGLVEPFFAYAEDLEMCWRCWQRDLRVEYVPTAVAVHHYEFSRTPLKMYLVERNRLAFILTCYGGRTLALLAPVLVAFELALVAVAAKQGWLRQKVRGWGWLVTHGGWIRARRAEVQRERLVPDRDLAHLMTDHFDPAQFPLPAGSQFAQASLARYWRAVRRAL